MEHRFWVNEIYPDTGRKLKKKGYNLSYEPSIGLFLEPEEVERLQLAYDSKELVDMIRTRSGNIVSS